MSVDLMAEVWKCKFEPKRSSWQQVLLVLADHAHDDGTRCFPGIPRISWKTGISERQVQRILKGMEDLKCIICVDGADGGRGYAKEYHIKLDALPKKQPFVPRSRFHAQKGDIMTPLEKGGEKGDIMTPLVAQKGDIQNQKGDIAVSEKGDITVSPQPSITINNHQSKQVSVLTDDLITFGKELVSLGGLPTKISFVPIKHWLEAGVSHDLIRNVIENRSSQALVSGKIISSFNYFDRAIREAQQCVLHGEDEITVVRKKPRTLGAYLKTLEASE